VSDEYARKVLREMENNAELYAKKATELSDMLERAEAFLREMPGKVDIIVVGDGGPDWDKLEFTRNQSDGWRLWYGPDDEKGAWVTEASVEIKASAAKLLPLLVQRLMDTQTSKLSEVECGLEALSQVPFLKPPVDGGKK